MVMQQCVASRWILVGNVGVTDQILTMIDNQYWTRNGRMIIINNDMMGVGVQ